MQKNSFELVVSKSIGSVSAELTSPANPEAIMTFAHGAGAGMNHPFMTSMANELAKNNIASLRFNFAYMEQKKKRPDIPAVAHKAVEAAANKAHELLPKIPLFLSGKSFGGRMSSQFFSIQKPSNSNGIIFLGFPLHPAGKPSIDRSEHLKEVNVPMLFLQGTRDTLAEWELIEKVTNELAHATLVKFEGADHSFKKGKENLIPSLAQTTAEWIKKVTK
jgi:predicted alpha/beta-hydrolase family hydrolase